MANMKFEKEFTAYAQVILQVGLNIQPGQRLLVGHSTRGNRTPVYLAPLARVIIEEAYKMGVPHVEVLWEDQQTNLAKLQHAPEEALSQVVDGKYLINEDFANNGDALFSLSSIDPDMYGGIDPNRVTLLQTTGRQNAVKTSQHIGKGTTNWNLACGPVPGWTAKVFPELSPEEGEEKFWQLIFQICRVDQPDPLAAWEEHLQQLAVRAQYLTDKQFDTLKYTAPGTDLTVGMPKNHIWRGGRVTSENGIAFTPNIPTEEVFSMPDRMRVDGTVTATKPLNLNGILIDGFSMTFKAGKVVDLKAQVGEDSLRNLVATDEGASYLGEVALVPHSSPISQSGRLFYNTLYDENASCHIALGAAYSMSMENGANMTPEEFQAAGGNRSLIHNDFMIGSGEMDIDGVTVDGKTEPVMRKGEWAIDV